MEVWLIMGRMIVETITSPFFLAVYLLLFTLVCWQYKRLENLSAGLIGKQAGFYLGSAIRSSLLGILGGLTGSVLLIMLGINLNAIGLAYLWVIALLLILVNPRFLCFSYAAGILSLASLIFSFPLINIAHLLALVAVLHLIDSLLILLNGHNYPIPLYIEKKGQVVGGFNLQKFWPYPFWPWWVCRISILLPALLCRIGGLYCGNTPGSVRRGLPCCRWWLCWDMVR